MKMAVFWLFHRVVWWKFANVSEVLTASIFRALGDDGGRKLL
jgi:hypothetical protein